MKKMEYGDTNGIWQVEGYQVLHQVEAEDIKSRLSVYTGETQQMQSSIQDNKASDSVIIATENEVLFYNVNDKDRIASVEQDDARYLVSLFESYSFEQIAVEGIPQYVIKTKNRSYLFDSKGHVVVSEGAIQGMFQLSQSDLENIISVIAKYDISLDEK